MSQPPLLHLPEGTDLKGRMYGCDCPCAVCAKRKRNFPQLHTGQSQSCPVELSLAPTIPAPCSPPASSINGSQRALEFPEKEGMENDSMPFQMAKCYFHFTDVRLRIKEPE